jgi:hypothetical protein
MPTSDHGLDAARERLREVEATAVSAEVTPRQALRRSRRFRRGRAPAAGALAEGKATFAPRPPVPAYRSGRWRRH